jgi:25S rRNA (cytosine2278-C5)-methyltransferase
LLCSKKGIAAASGGIKDAILRHRTRLKAEFVKVKLSNKNGLECKSSSDHTNVEDFLPRWARVNTLKKTTLDNIIKKLDELSLVRVTSLEELEDEPEGYMIDANVQNLIALHHSNDVLEKLSQDYATIFQDKASCIPSDLLDANSGDIVLDACAAPGNKTMQVAASIAPSGHVYAVEKDAERFLTLKTRLAKAGASESASNSSPL